ncbi:hemerythrin domain-containing protein [Streptomyces graminifolii]|uniref:hemerythrin domain-containing protein n=1 Tax=Streptomyces graminifolii TaxID=1266771 RepID=UPI0040583403
MSIDFTAMYASHDAFRRDLERLASAVSQGRAFTLPVRAGWDNFKHQLHVHHTAEDSDLWPRVRQRVVGRGRDLALLDDMEAEHARIDPLLDAVDVALAERASELPDLVRALLATLDDHLKHEEDRALPLMREVLTGGDWAVFTGRMRKEQGVRGPRCSCLGLSMGCRGRSGRGCWGLFLRRCGCSTGFSGRGVIGGWGFGVGSRVRRRGGWARSSPPP